MKSFKRAIFISFMSVCFLYGDSEKLFDLEEQYFSETMKEAKHRVQGRYDLPKVIVDTNARYEVSSKIYTTSENATSFISVSLKEPTDNWAYIENRLSYSTNSCYRTAGGDAIIRLTSTKGNSFVVAINQFAVTVDGDKFDIKMESRNTYLTEIIKNDDIFLAKINGTPLLKRTIKEFGKLARVETSIPHYNKCSDDITKMEIYSK